MDKILHVYIDQEKVGTLTGNESGNYIFVYDAGWLDSKTPIPLSLSLPLQTAPFTAELSRAFFANLLPEGQLRDHFASKYRVSADDDFELLAALGGDCAGALALYPGGPEQSFEPAPPSYRPLTEQDLGRLLDEAYIMDPSFLGEGERTRLSLAGVQDKLPVAIHGDTISLPLDGSPSTHILKPPNHRFPNLVENEAFCMALARALGLKVPDSSLLQIRDRGVVYLVERYDRTVDKQGMPSRIHQEDLCQATGSSYRLKYEERGGPGFQACFQIIGRCRQPLADRIKLIELAVFNYLIANADCHAKNISLLYDRGPNPSLAPFYDLVCTGSYNLSRQMAMAIGGAYDPRDINGIAWANFAEQAGIPSPKPVMDTLKRMAAAIPGKAEATANAMIERYGENPIYKQIVQTISQRAEMAIRQVRSL
ncbi:type II toxin-antitoxin system HipA family toxin [Trichloromonas sp.]|uniref:type II toxin-antitoxin system HipA family toxin n=1 Tax=Trichloromonas sp. TaxID=3069249 RepID=UPI003D81B9DA